MIGASLKENEWYKDFLQPADARTDEGPASLDL
jgi:hypothetical protein